MTEYPFYVEVCCYHEKEHPNSQDNYRVELIIEGTILGLSYGISKERANELAGKIASRLGVEAKLKE
jgi:hypothetical protein